MIDNLPHLFLDRASIRPDLMVGVLDDQISLRVALELAAGGQPTCVPGTCPQTTASQSWRKTRRITFWPG